MPGAARPRRHPGPEPLPVTQIELTRAESDAIDWDTVTVEDLVRGVAGRPARARAAGEHARWPTYPAYAALVGDGEDDPLLNG